MNERKKKKAQEILAQNSLVTENTNLLLGESNTTANLPSNRFRTGLCWCKQILLNKQAYQIEGTWYLPQREG